MRRYQSLRGRREFALVLRRGRSSSCKHVAVFSLMQQRGTPAAKVGIVVTKKVGSAVERNRLRRRCKAILDETLHVERGRWLLIQFRPGAAELTFADLRAQLCDALARGQGGAGKPPSRSEPSRR